MDQAKDLQRFIEDIERYPQWVRHGTGIDELIKRAKLRLNIKETKKKKTRRKTA